MPDEKDTPHQNSPQDRRSMFLLGFRKLIEPVAGYIEQRLDVALPVFREVLRPPGAVAEKKFRETCYRCGNCTEACPAKAIRPLAAELGDSTANSPTIDPDLSACVVCDSLACMKACPSGALRLVEPTDIRMGAARVRLDRCLRSQGQDCSLCVDKCPMGLRAIQLNGGHVEVIVGGCVGCGSCQFYCPAMPKAIVVDPQ